MATSTDDTEGVVADESGSDGDRGRRGGRRRALGRRGHHHDYHDDDHRDGHQDDPGASAHEPMTWVICVASIEEKDEAATAPSPGSGLMIRRRVPWASIT